MSVYSHTLKRFVPKAFFKETQNKHKSKTSQSKPANEPAFKWRGTRAIYTFPEHVPVSLLVKGYNLLTRTCPLMKVFHEKGASGYIHTHVVTLYPKRVEISSAKRWAQFRALLGNFDIKNILSDEHFMNAISYDQSKKKESKEMDSVVVCDTIGEWEPADPYHIQVLKFLQNAKTWAEVLRNPEHSKYLSGCLSWAREIYTNARCTRDFNFASGKPLQWQSTILDFILQPCTDNRSVHWIYDFVGGNGKSELTSYLIAKHSAFCVDGGAMKDIAYAYDNQPIVVFDLSRDTEEYCPYRTIEGFKNGRLFSSKYQSSLKTFEPPHVFVFANYKPIEEKLSADRWDILTLDDFQLDKKPARGVPISIKDPPGNLAEIPESEEDPASDDSSPPSSPSMAKNGLFPFLRSCKKIGGKRRVTKKRRRNGAASKLEAAFKETKKEIQVDGKK